LYLRDLMPAIDLTIEFKRAVKDQESSRSGKRPKISKPDGHTDGKSSVGKEFLNEAHNIVSENTYLIPI
jgi:hypothetical protein